MKQSARQKFIIIGGGGHARVLADCLDASGQVAAGYADIKPCSSMPCGYLGNDQDVVAHFKPAEVLLVNGIGSVRLPELRQKVYEHFKNKGFSFARIVHPRAFVSSQSLLGEGVQVMAGAVIQTGANIAENVIVNTCASVDHDCRIGAHTHIAPGVTLSGEVRIGAGCHIGTGAKIIQGIKISDGVLIAAGTIVKVDP